MSITIADTAGNTFYLAGTTADTQYNNFVTLMEKRNDPLINIDTGNFGDVIPYEVEDNKVTKITIRFNGVITGADSAYAKREKNNLEHMRYVSTTLTLTCSHFGKATSAGADGTGQNWDDNTTTTYVGAITNGPHFKMMGGEPEHMIGYSLEFTPAQNVYKA